MSDFKQKKIFPKLVDGAPRIVLPCHAMATRRKRNRRIKGITADALKLGVTRDHLRLVLQGKRNSEQLTARYASLKRETLQPRPKETQ